MTFDRVEQVKNGTTFWKWWIYRDGDFLVCNKWRFSVSAWEEYARAVKDASQSTDVLALRDKHGKRYPQRSFKSPQEAIAYFSEGNISFTRRAHDFVAKEDSSIGEYKPKA
jgi:hypothetical protein